MTNNWPLSGAVSQVISPMQWWIRTLSQQTGFININNVRSTDPEMERRIIEDVASYGRQLGRIMEALDVVVRHAPPDALTADEQRALGDFSDLVRRVEAIKDESRPATPTPARVERLIGEVRALEHRDERAYGEIVARLREAFPSDR